MFLFLVFGTFPIMGKYIQLFLVGFISVLFVSQVEAQERACSPVLTPFVCKTNSGQKIGRCAAAKSTYNLEQDGMTYVCEPVIQSTKKARETFLSLVQKPNEAGLKNSKKAATIPARSTLKRIKRCFQPSSLSTQMQIRLRFADCYLLKKIVPMKPVMN